MKSFLPLVFAFGMANTAAAGSCSSNNCAKAITCDGNNRAVETSHSSDCSRLLQTTVTPNPVTVHTTVTVTGSPALVTVKTSTNTLQKTILSTTTVTTLVPQTLLGKRAGAAYPALPTYASVCSDFNAYSSACSCWGIGAKTVTAATPTVTQTCTTTVKPTVTSVGFVTLTVSKTSVATATVTSYVNCIIDTIWYTSLTTLTGCGCNYSRNSCSKPVVAAGTTSTTTTATSAADCATKADAQPWAYSFGYNTVTGQCLLIGSKNPASVADASWNMGTRLAQCTSTVGTCIPV